jgi:uncharacterized protein (TIGR00255 family)
LPDVAMTNNNTQDPQPLRSMTGYARVRRETSLGELTLSLRSVNHRGLDPHFHQGSEFAPFENAIRARLKGAMARGHVEVRISLSRKKDSARAQYNQDLLGHYVGAYRAAAETFGIHSDFDLNAALRIPGVLSAEADGEIESSFEPEVIAALDRCLDELNAFREREGAQIRELLRREAEAIDAQTKQMKAIRKQALPQFQSRLSERLSALLGGAGIEPRRLAEEAAILTDRSDVEEELARLEIHTGQLFDMLESGGEIGKRLDFLLQEMNRETNTVLSKTSGIGEAGLTMTNLALATKAHIEKIREQALNVE